jgi:uncharacterized C2H2 Zn-finger protein
MNIINNVNAKTNNAMDNFNPCKEYVNIETDAFLVAATMEYFGMHKLNEPAENVIPPDVLNASKQEKRIWLHRHAKMILEKFVMTEQEKSHTEIRESVLREQQLSEARRHECVCPVCSKKYRYRKCLEKHVRQLHPNITLMPSPTESVKASAMPGTTTKSDDRFNYACVRLALGLLLRNFDDAVKEGDGARILRCWKMAMLIFRAHHHHKYALASLHLQAATQAILTPRQAHSLTWNRTVNNHGGKGRNISMDLRLEHLNNFTKGLLKHLGPNLTNNAVLRCSHATNNVEKILDVTDEDLGMRATYGTHKTTRSDDNFKKLVSVIKDKGDMFHHEISEQRQYQHFSTFSRNILGSVDHRLLHKWIKEHMRELARLQGQN